MADSPYSSGYPTAQYHENFPDGVQTFFSNDAATNKTIIHGFVFTSGNDDFIVKYEEVVPSPVPTSPELQILKESRIN